MPNTSTAATRTSPASSAPSAQRSSGSTSPPSPVSRLAVDPVGNPRRAWRLHARVSWVVCRSPTMRNVSLEPWLEFLMTEESAAVVESTTQIDLSMLNDTLEYIRPALQADGGDLILLGVDGGTVNLQLVGACGGGPMSTMTLTAGIERILRDRVPGVEEINAV